MNVKNYIKSPYRVSRLIPKILNPLKKKLGGKAILIKSEWKKIVGEEISEKCYVESIKKFNNKNILTLVSDDSSVLELSYSSEYIKDKINNFNPDFNINEIKFKKIFQK